MASKEATVYIVDVSASSGRKHHGRDIVDLDWMLQYVWDKITAAVATERKTLGIGIVGLKTDGTKNEMDEDGSYSNITVFQEIKQTLLSDVRQLKELLVPSNTNYGDALSALVVAIQMIVNHCKKLKYIRRIVLITNGRGAMDTDESDSIIAKIKEEGIELVVLGADFDDPEYGVKEEEKRPDKTTNEEFFRNMCAECDGVFGTLAQAVDELSIPRLKNTRSTATYKGVLKLGNPEEYESALCINVERYAKIMPAKVPAASRFAVRNGRTDGGETVESSITVGNDNKLEASILAPVRPSYAYSIKDDTATGGRMPVDRETLAKGFEYGRTVVHIAESDQDVTRLETFTGLDIIGFVASEQYERYFHMSKVNFIVSQKLMAKEAVALSSFIHALYELESYAVARLVTKDGREPVIVLLAPHLETDFEALLEVELPFAEDVRQYKFPPLDKIMTVSGKILTEHRNLPSSDLMDAMGDYIDSMDLSMAGVDDDGEPTEAFPIENTFSPTLHRISQAIKHRAVHPDQPLPPVAPILTEPSKIPSEILQKSQASIDRLTAASNVKKVPPKSKGRFHRRKRSVEKPLSGLDVASLLSQNRASSSQSTSTSTTPQNQTTISISTTNPIPEFKQLLSNPTTTLPQIQTAITQMLSLASNLITSSLGDANYLRAIEILGTVREECVELEEVEGWNEGVRKLKEKCFEEADQRREMWLLIRRARLGLIEKREVDVSEVEEKEAKEFLKGV